MKPKTILAPHMEYLIPDGREIESWSFGTPEHYDEIVRDLQRYKSVPSWIGYNLTRGSGIDGRKGDALFLKIRLDDHNWAESALKKALLGMISTILSGSGRIYYSQGSCRNRELEFKTRFPTYINPSPPAASAVLRSVEKPASAENSDEAGSDESTGASAQ